jgi:hypothetical protein
MRYKNTDAVAIKEEGATKMPNELKPTIDEAIEHFNKKREQCKEDGFKHLADFWGGYCSALYDVKNGLYRLEQESKR